MNSARWVGVIAGLAIVAAGCGSDDAGSPADSAPAAPTDTAAPGSAPETTADTVDRDDSRIRADAEAVPGAVPTRIISLSPTHTEMLFAIGAGDQVVAVDGFSNHPPEAAEKMTELSGFEPNVEAIAGYEPDLVVTDGTNPDLVAQLESLGIPTWQGPAAASFGDVFDQIEQLGVATGHVAEAAELVSSMQTEIDAITRWDSPSSTRRSPTTTSSTRPTSRSRRTRSSATCTTSSACAASPTWPRATAASTRSSTPSSSSTPIPT
jgi:iron complex transport system substrate-binding protein